MNETIRTYPHLTSAPASETDWFKALVNLTRYLRSPDGCPWDQGKSALDFAAYASDEVEELREALASGDNRHAEEEFGDCLFTLLACLAAAEAEGRFSLLGALERAHEKMVRRHDHVFAEDRATTPEEAMASWNAEKAREKARENNNDQ